MAKLRINRDVLHRPIQRSILTADERATVDRLLGEGNGNGNGNGKGAVSLDVAACPLAFLKALLDEARLTPNQRAVVAMQVHGMGGLRTDRDAVYGTPVANSVEFGSVFATLGNKAPNCEIFLGGRWYPITLNVQFLNDPDDQTITRAVLLHATLSLCDFNYQISYVVWADLFLDDAGHRLERTVADILHQFGLRRVQTAPADFNLRLVRAERTAREHGQVVLVSGNVLVRSVFAWWSRPESRALGTPELPRKAVVEPELEVAEQHRGYYSPYGQNREAVSRLPFVRVFSLDTKTYVYAEVDDVTPYEFDTNAMGKLHLPQEMLSILTRVFHTPVEA